MEGLNLTPSFTIDTNNIIHVVWSHKVTNQHYIIMHTQSEDDGLTWVDADTVLNIPNAWLYRTNISCDNRNQLVLTFDSISWGGTYTQVYAIEYDGVLWSTQKRISSINNAKENRIIADHSGRVYCFWHEYYNQAYKIMYRFYENGQWSDTYVPYSDTNEYVLENIDVDIDNNLHGIGYFTGHGQSYDETVFVYFRYEYFNNQWAAAEFVNNSLPFRGCAIAADTLLLPQVVFSQYTSLLPFDYGMLYRKQGLWGWEPADTILNHEEEYYPQIGINSLNEPEIVTVETITNENTLLYNYYKKDGEYFREIIDSNGSFLFKSLRKTNNSIKLIYGKMPLNTGWNGIVYYTSKSIFVSVNEQLENTFTIYPNPGNGTFELTFEWKAYNNRASITIYDIYGKAVFGKTDIQLLRGNNTILIDLLKNNNYLSAGVYRVVLQSGQWIVQSNYLLIQ
jgi:hypothetical protein